MEANLTPNSKPWDTPTASEYTLRQFESTTIDIINEWKRKVIKKDTDKDTRQTCALVLAEFVRAVDRVYSDLDLVTPEDIRKAYEI